MTPLLDHVPAQFPLSGKCKIAFIGEAPSDYERIYGAPLVGPSGRTFDQILRVAGLACEGGGLPQGSLGRAERVRRLLDARTAYLVTNVFDEQLPDNSVKAWCAPAQEAKTWQNYDLPPIKGAGWLRPEYCHHLERLAEELRRCSPTLVVPLGATALWAMTGVSDITLARGAVSTTSPFFGSIKCLPTHHPAHVNQEFKLFHVVVTDLVKAAAEAEFPEVRLSARKIHIRPTVRDLVGWRSTLVRQERLAVDIETAKQQITCIGFAPSAEEAFVIPFADYANPSKSYWSRVEEEMAAWDLVRALCEGPAVKTFQNGLYDCYYLIRQAGIWPRNYSEDTRLMHHALYPELPKSLAFMGSTYANLGPWKLMADHRHEEKRDA